MIAFTRRKQVIDDATGQLTATESTIECEMLAMIEGNILKYAEQFKAAGLVLGSTPVLLVAPLQYGLKAWTEEFVMPGDVVPLNGIDWTVKANLEITAPDGIVIVAEIAVAR